uniref:NS5-like protein n=1 Tax=Soybean thrips virus 2 TaxID=2796561 RepID=A0A7T3R0J4_9FLAV|nr:NS5-like protein [Soybean thrips virus 2]
MEADVAIEDHWGRVAAPVILVVGLVLYAIERAGANNMGPMEFLEFLRDKVGQVGLPEFGRLFKTRIKELSSAAFARMKMRGVKRVKKNPQIVSRGYQKLEYILKTTKLKPVGVVLSLCCGRGGWEQLIARFPSVIKIISVTFGKTASTPGHEDFVRARYEGWQKIELFNQDVKTFPTIKTDWLLFDGGESRPDGEIEAAKFNELFRFGPLRQIHSQIGGFILKVLTPTHPETMAMMKKIQEVTNRGDLVRVNSSRNSNLEVYLVSTQRVNLESRMNQLLMNMLNNALAGGKPEMYNPEGSLLRDKPPTNITKILKKPNYEKSIKGLDIRNRSELGNDYKQWESLGVYNIGMKGNSSTTTNIFSGHLMHKLDDNLDGYGLWKLTDTTPRGLNEVFRKKVDTCPLENHKYQREFLEVYRGLADYYTYRGFRLKELTWEEVEVECNKMGAPGYADVGIVNIADYLKQPNWRKKVEEARRELLKGTPIEAIFNIIAKREKAKVNINAKAKGSRMIAFQGITMRLLELKLFGNLLKLTKPEMNRFGVGGLGLHDLGMRLEEVWLGCGISDDVAGYDTRVGLFVQSVESEFITMLGGGECHRAMYEVYAHPLILAPIPSPPGTYRSELLQGQGQVMSGRAPTYSQNTQTRIALFLTSLAVVEGVKMENIREWTKNVMLDTRGTKTDVGGVVSGDDATFTTKNKREIFGKLGPLLDEMGFQRKNIVTGQPSEILECIEDVEFCSHQYESITYKDSYNDVILRRRMPTRQVSEIIAKATFRVGAYGGGRSQEAWAATQAVNLLVNYHHLRTVRAFGIALKSLTNENLVLTDAGGFLRPTPWLRKGDILEIINEVLFGKSTKYPVKDFKVREFGHLGYIGRKREPLYDPNCYSMARRRWREQLYDRVKAGISKLRTGGNMEWIEDWHEKRTIRKNNDKATHEFKYRGSKFKESNRWF